jgi:hypothetical protein
MSRSIKGLIIRSLPIFVILIVTGELASAGPAAGRINSAGVGSDVEPQIILLGASPQQIDLQAVLPMPKLELKKAGGHVYTHITGSGYGLSAQVGLPELPVLRQDVEIPFGASFGLTIEAVEYTDIDLKASGQPVVLPRQPPLSKAAAEQGETPGQDALWVEDHSFYEANQAYPSAPVTSGEEYIMRGHRFLVVEAWPAVYNPDAGSLRIYSKIRFHIELTGSDMARTLALAQRYASPVYDERLSQHALNWNQGVQHIPATPTAQPGYLIISADEYAGALKPFVSILEKRGFNVSLAILSQIPGADRLNAIKNYIKAAYNGLNPPSYALLVGDTDTIPAWPGTQSPVSFYTDLYYFTMEDGDFHPDIEYGRLPVRSAAETAAVVQKYQAYYDLTGQEAWIKKAAFISSCDTSYYMIPEATHNFVINSFTKPAGYIGSFPTANNPGGDQIFCKTYNGASAQIMAALHEGRWLLAYSGHGDETGWADGAISFNQSNIRNLAGQGYFPFIASFACLTGSFGSTQYDETFGETWILQPNKGALAFWGAGADTYWDEDDKLERSMFEALFTNSPDKPHLAEMIDYALSQVEAAYPTSAKYYWEAYNLLGDPSVKVFREPERPIFTLDVTPDQAQVCAQGVVTTTARVGSLNGYSGQVQLQIGSLPQKTSAWMTDLKGTAPFESQISLGVELGAGLGNHAIPITALDAQSLMQSQTLNLSIENTIPGLPGLVSPAPGAINMPLQPVFQWDPSAQTYEYRFQLADNPLFKQPLNSEANLVGPSAFLGLELAPDSCYWWRAGGDNACGSSAWSLPAHFSTLKLNQDFADDIENGSSQWSEAVTIGATHWSITPGETHSGSHAWRIPDPGNTSDSQLWTTTPFPTQASSRLTFWHLYQFEPGGFDGAVLEISTDGGATWSDLGSNITTAGYTGVVDGRFGKENPLAGRQAWIGKVDTWTQVTVDLSAYAGNMAQVRWRIGSDASVGDAGWAVDDVLLTSTAAELPPPALSGVSSDTVSGLAATPLIINGSGLTGTVALQLGDTWLLSTTLVSSNIVEAVIPQCMSSGTYTLSLYNGDCQETDLPNAVTIIRNDHTFASIEVGSPVIYEPITFTAVVSGVEPLTYQWDFGGPGYGSGLDSATPIFTYVRGGNYWVSLTIGGTGCPILVKRRVTVAVYNGYLPLIVQALEP